MSPRLRNPVPGDPLLRTALGFVAGAVLGWAIRSLPIAIVGMLGAATAVALYVWHRDCLTGVSYRRSLSQSRASFGEEVTLEVELVNDKLLPLAFLHVEDEVPAALAIPGITAPEASPFGRQRGSLVHLRPMLPYQRVRRRLPVRCTRRGLHSFGPAELRSGDPVGLRSAQRRLGAVDHLLVYPKLFTLLPEGLAARALVGDERAARRLLEDPSRVAGVREYRAGDPVRHIDWRASARTSALLVRQFEPTVTLRVALFLDIPLPRVRDAEQQADQIEFNIAVGASILAELSRRRVAAGLFSSGLVERRQLAFAPSTSPGALPAMLDALARAGAGPRSLAEVVRAEAGRLRSGTAAVVVATDYGAGLMTAIGDLRRRHAVTAVHVATESGAAPARDLVDSVLVVEYRDDWPERTVLELAA